MSKSTKRYYAHINNQLRRPGKGFIASIYIAGRFGYEAGMAPEQISRDVQKRLPIDNRILNYSRSRARSNGHSWTW